MGSVTDLIIVVICLFFAVRGMFFGFVSEILSLVAYVAAYFVSVIFSPPLIRFLQIRTNFSDIVLQIASYSLLFLLTYVLVKIVEVFLVRMTNKSIISGLNRSLGVVFGLIQGILVVLILDFLLRIQPIIDLSEQLNDGTLLRILKDYFNSIHQFVLEIVS